MFSRFRREGRCQKSQQMYGFLDNVMIPINSSSIIYLYIYYSTSIITSVIKYIICIMLQYHEIIYIYIYITLYYIILNGKTQHSAHFDYSVVSTKPGPHDAATAGAPPTAAPTATIATVMPLLLLVVLWYVVVGYSVGVVVVLLLCGGGMLR